MATKNQAGGMGPEAKENYAGSSEITTAALKSESLPVAASKQAVVPQSKQGGNVFTERNKSDDDRFARPDESDGPYVLVQSKKKREKKKQQRESGISSKSLIYILLHEIINI